MVYDCVMRPWMCILFLLAAVCAGCARRAEEAVPTIDREIIQEAIRYGRINAEKSFGEFVEDWTVDTAYEQGNGRAVLMTPFLSIALMAQKAALSGVDVDYRLVDRILRRDAGVIRFYVMLYGNEPDFARKLIFRLKVNGRLIEPCQISIPRYGEFTRDYYNVASGSVSFPSVGIASGSTVILSVTFPQEEVGAGNRECNFVFDLSRYR